SPGVECRWLPSAVYKRGERPHQFVCGEHFRRVKPFEKMARGLDKMTTGTRLFGWCAVMACAAYAQPTSTSDFFEMKIRPILARNCFSCHTGSELARISHRTSPVSEGGASKRQIAGG